VVLLWHESNRYSLLSCSCVSLPPGQLGPFATLGSLRTTHWSAAWPQPLFTVVLVALVIALAVIVGGWVGCLG